MPFQILRAVRIELGVAIGDADAGTGIERPEEETGEEVAGYESEKMERFEIMTSSELINLVRKAPALRNSFDVTRATNWFRKKANTLHKLESRTPDIINVFHSPYRCTVHCGYNVKKA